MEFIEKYFKYIMIFLAAVMIIVLLIIASEGKDDEDDAGISGGVDIAVMPTKEAESTTNDSMGIRGIIINIDTSKQTMVLQEVGTSTKITYSYTGGTEIVNRYDTIASVSQLMVGEVVDVEFATNKKLSRIKVSSEDWEYKNATGFSIDTQNKTLTIGSDKYYYNDNTVVACNDNIITIDKLESIDVVTLRGREKQLDSIIVTEGHGYVRLDNTTFFEGGFVEIGSKIVELITENMVIPVPVGDYTITVTKTDTSGSKDISVGANEEIRVNLTEFQSDAVRLGTLSFKIEPEGATLTIDGVKKNYSELVEVAYGTHKIVVSAKGYKPYSQVINVEEILKEYTITLEKSEETSNQESDNSDKEEENASKTSNVTATTKSAAKETTTSQTIDYGSLINDLFQ